MQIKRSRNGHSFYSSWFLSFNRMNAEHFFYPLHVRLLFLSLFCCRQEPYKPLKYASGVMFSTYTSLVASNGGSAGGGVRSRLDQLVLEKTRKSIKFHNDVISLGPE